MAILIDKNTKVLVQGITGKEGARSTKEMLDYGTQVLCGVTPGKGGQEIEGLPVYNTVEEALQQHDVNTSVVYVPPAFAKNAVVEAIKAGIKLIVLITENIPIHDVAYIIAFAKQHNACIIGPSSIGIISPGKAKIGSIGGRAFSEGNIGIISKSGGMSSETALLFTQARLGQSTILGIGGDVLIATPFTDLLALFEKDKETKAVVLFGEIGGTAGAIIEGGKGTRESKINALKEAGVMIAEVHHELVDLIKDVIKK